MSHSILLRTSQFPTEWQCTKIATLLTATLFKYSGPPVILRRHTGFHKNGRAAFLCYESVPLRVTFVLVESL
jgi:hypothetical protein